MTMRMTIFIGQAPDSQLATKFPRSAQQVTQTRLRLLPSREQVSAWEEANLQGEGSDIRCAVDMILRELSMHPLPGLFAILPAGLYCDDPGIHPHWRGARQAGATARAPASLCPDPVPVPLRTTEDESNFP